MSVNFNVRRVNDALLAGLRRAPSITAALCGRDVDFDPQAYARPFLTGDPELVESRRAFLERKVAGFLEEQRDALASLGEASVDRRDIGQVLHIGKSAWGMESMIATPIGCRLIDEKEGEAIGDDVGYGPARLLSPLELTGILTELDAVTRELALPRFRATQEAELARRREDGVGLFKPSTDEEFDTWSWKPFCALREFVRATHEEQAWLLKWYD